MNKLDTKKRAAVVAALAEGCSVRATARMTGISKPTILKVLADLGPRARGSTVRRSWASAPAGSSVMKSGRSDTPKKRTSPKSARGNGASVTCGRGPLSTRTPSSAFRGRWGTGTVERLTPSCRTWRIGSRPACS